MRPRRRPLLALLTIGMTCLPVHADEASGERSAVSLRDRLRHLVDLPTPEARAREAARLAKAGPEDWPTWAAALASVQAQARPVPGTRTHALDPDGDGPVPAGIVTVVVPASLSAKGPHPLLVAYAGTGGDGRGMARMWAAVAEQARCLVVAPGIEGGVGAYEFTNRERDTARAWVRWARRAFHVDPGRIAATGVSRGGHLVWDLALRHPDLFAGIAPVVGGPRLTIQHGQNNLRYLAHLVDVSIRDVQGAQDDPLLVENLKLAFARLQTHGATDAQLVLVPDQGHHVTVADRVDWPAWLQGLGRVATPKTARRVAAREGEGRAHWVEITAFDRKVQEVFPLRPPAKAWPTWSPAQQRAWVAGQAEQKSARLEATLAAPGLIRIRAQGVKRARLFLTRDMLDAEGRVEIRWKGRTLRKRPKPDVARLLTDFAERLDARAPTWAAVDLR